MIYKRLLILAALLLCCFAIFIIQETIPPARASLILTDYFKLKERFIKAAQSQQATLQELPISAHGPDGQQLSFQVAWFGSTSPKRALLHISGTHGVEGYAGSAIQTLVIEKGFTVPDDTAVIFVHGLNPWGMSHYRRFNESNIDLNRNFLLQTSDFSGAPQAYRLIKDFLNPEGMPSRLDLFYPLVVMNVIRYGFDTLKQAIAGGQYEFENGIYFGGKSMAESLQKFKYLLLEKLQGVEKLYVIEIHTGLGTSGKDVLFWPLSLKDPKSVAFQAALSEELSTDAPDEGVGFRTPGDLQNEVPKLLPQTEMYWLLQEFGAYGPVRTLRALRDENRYHQSGGQELTHWSKQSLVEAFCPGDEEWQKAVLERGEVLFKKMLSLSKYSPHS